MNYQKKRPSYLLCLVIAAIFLQIITYYLFFMVRTPARTLYSQRQLFASGKTAHTPATLTQYDLLCTLLVRNDTNVLFAETLKSFSRPSSDRFDFSTELGCHRFRQINGRPPEVSDEELSYPLAFSFNIHSDFMQFARLFRAVYRPHNIYCLHVDKKADQSYRRNVTRLAGCFGYNVHVIPNEQSISIKWGDLGTLEAWFLCARHFIKQSATKWKYMLNGSGQEFPLLTNWELVKALRALNGSNVVESYTDKQRDRIPRKALSFNVSQHCASMHISR